MRTTTLSVSNQWWAIAVAGTVQTSIDFGAGSSTCFGLVGRAGGAASRFLTPTYLATLLVDSADRSSLRLGDDEHRRSIGGGRQRARGCHS
jgi:hypothetical protein